MRAAVFREVGKPMEIEDVLISKPRPREVLIRTAAAGVCHSDLNFFDGTYPYPLPSILGHESAGVVEQVGSDVTYVKPGDHVVTCFSAFCGHCEFCLTGHMSLCQSSETQRGNDDKQRLETATSPITQFFNLSSFSEQMLVHEHAIARIRKDMPLDLAALIGCSVTTGVGSVFHTAKVEPGTSIAVIGCGGVGLNCINGAAIAGAGRIIAVDTLDSKLNLAKEFGATDVINASGGNVVEQVKELTSGGVHYSFEAIGLKNTTEQAFQMLARRGTATVIGAIPPGQMIEVHGMDFLAEKKIQGSYMGSSQFRVDVPRLVDFYMDGRLKLDQMVSERIGLEAVNTALEALKTGELTRQVIIFDD